MNSVPSGYKPNPAKDNVLPGDSLSISYVHGFRCFFLKDECRGMAKYLNTGKVAFATAAIGVVIDGKRNQSFFV
jgi:hypothetical protein